LDLSFTVVACGGRIFGKAASEAEARHMLTVLAGMRQAVNTGLAQLQQYSGQAFAAASFRVALEPGEFLLVAPGRQADLYGIVGGAFLTGDQDGQRYESYVFLRADVNHVAYRR
jgi:hypothetical protein